MKIQNGLDLDFPESRGAKSKLVLITFIVALLIAYTLSGVGADVLPAILFFPLGLLFILPSSMEHLWNGNGSDPSAPLRYVPFIWIIYIGLALLIILTKKRRASIIAYCLFIALLLANIAGCSSTGIQ